MNALKAVVSEKRKALQDDGTAATRPSKYMRRGDIERLKEETKAREAKEREEAAQSEAEAKALLRKLSIVSFAFPPLVLLQASDPHVQMENRPLRVRLPTRLILVL